MVAFLLLFLGFIVGARIYSRIPQKIKTRKYKLQTFRLPKSTSIKIAQLSDFHVHDRMTLKNVSRAVEATIEEKPDIIFLTGDYFTGQIVFRKQCIEILSKLSATCPTYAIAGNHDGGKWSNVKNSKMLLVHKFLFYIMPYNYKKYIEFDNLNPDTIFEMLNEAGITTLENESTLLEIKNSRIRITGLGDYFNRRFFPRQIFSNIVDEVPHIVLAHEPHVYRFIPYYKWDLLLAGHLHGGQIVLPVIGYSHLNKIYDKKYIHGLQTIGNRHIHISAGIGATFDIRIGVPPEVSIIQWENL